MEDNSLDLRRRYEVNPCRTHRVELKFTPLGTNLGALLAALPTTLSNCVVTHVLSSKPSALGLQRAINHSPSIPTSAFSLLQFKKQTNHSRDEYDLALAEKIRKTRPDLVVLAGWMLILSEGFLLNLVRDWDEEEAVQATPTDGTERDDDIESLPTPGKSPYAAAVGPDLAELKTRAIPIINLHPALPGTFPGAHAILDAWNAFNLPPTPVVLFDSTTPTPPAPFDDSLSLAGLTISSSPSSSVSPTTTTAAKRITKTGIMIHRVIPLLDAGEPVVVREIPMIEGESLEGLEDRIHVVEHEAIVEAVRVVVELLGQGKWWK